MTGLTPRPDRGRAGVPGAEDGAPSRTELERWFFLDDADRALIEPKALSDHRMASGSIWRRPVSSGVFLNGPADVPVTVINCLRFERVVDRRVSESSHRRR